MSAADMANLVMATKAFGLLVLGFGVWTLFVAGYHYALDGGAMADPSTRARRGFIAGLVLITLAAFALVMT